jgi:hypothetical protein
MTIDVGFALQNGLIVSEPFDDYEHPAWWLSCPQCHCRVFATTEMIEEGTVPACKECVSIDAARAARKKTDELIAAGREEEPNFLEENL